MNRRIAGEVLGKASHIIYFHAEVEFFSYLLGELFDQSQHVEKVNLVRVALSKLRHTVQDVHIYLSLSNLYNVGTLHLQHHLFAPEYCTVDLGERGRRQRFIIEALEQLIYWLTQLRLNDASDDVCRHQMGASPQSLELDDIFRRYQVRACAEQLTYLNESWPQLLKGGSKPLWGGEFNRAFSFTPENVPPDVAGFPDTYSAHGFAKAVSDEHINDLPEALQALNSAASR